MLIDLTGVPSWLISAVLAYVIVYLLKKYAKIGELRNNRNFWGAVLVVFILMNYMGGTAWVLSKIGGAGGGISFTPPPPPTGEETKTAAIKFRAKDATGQASVANYEIYVFHPDVSGELPTDDMNKLLDLEARGKILNPTAFSSEVATVYGITAKAGDEIWCLATPTSYAASGWQPKLFKIRINSLKLDDTGTYFTDVSGTTLRIFKMADLKIFYGGSEYTTYTETDNTSTDQISVDMPIACDDQYHSSVDTWLYVDYGSATIDYVWFNGVELELEDITNLPGTSALRKNAPSGYDYIAYPPGTDFGPVLTTDQLKYLTDPRQTITLKFQYDVSNVDTTIKFKFVAFAKSENADIAMLEIQYKILDTGTAGFSSVLISGGETTLFSGLIDTSVGNFD